MAPVLVTLNDLDPGCRPFKCNPSNSCAVFYQISTDSVIARSLSDSWASCFPVRRCWGGTNMSTYPNSGNINDVELMILTTWSLPDNGRCTCRTCDTDLIDRVRRCFCRDHTQRCYCRDRIQRCYCRRSCYRCLRWHRSTLWNIQ